MKLTISENIRRLRRERGMTQERLAELMGVTNQAVSKWESQSTYPDITALIPLAEIFGVSVDELLGNKISERAARNAEVKATLKRIRYDDRQSEADYLEYARKAVAEFPADEELQHELAWALKCCVYYADDLDGDEKENMTQEAEKILLRLMDTVRDETLRCRVVYALVDLYANCLHDANRALSVADRLPEMEWCREIVKADAFSGGKIENRDIAIRCQQEAILELADNLGGKIAALSRYVPAEEEIAMRRTANRIYELIYGDDLPWETLLTNVSANHLAIARAQAAHAHAHAHVQGKASETLCSLEKMCDAAEAAANAFKTGERRYASAFLDRLSPAPESDAECRTSVFRNQVGYRLQGLESKAFDVFRENERFSAVVARLKALEKGIEEPQKKNSQNTEPKGRK